MTDSGNIPFRCHRIFDVTPNKMSFRRPFPYCLPAISLMATVAVVAMATLPVSWAANPPKDLLGRCFELRRSEPQAAVRLAESILGTPDLPVESEIKALSCLGMAAGIAGDGKRAASTAARIQNLVNQHPGLPPEFVLRAISNAGAIFHGVGQVHQAELAYARVNEIARQAGGGDAAITQAVNLTNIGLIHADYLDSPEVAESYYRQALAIAKTVGYEDLQLLYNHATNLIRLDQRQEALEVLMQAEALAKKADNQLMGQRVRTERAGLLIAQGKLSQARALLVEALGLQRTLPDPAGEASSLVKLSALQRASGHNAPALRSADQAWALVAEGYYQAQKVEALRARFASHIALGETAKAMHAARLLHDLKMGALKRQRLELLADLQARSQDAVARSELEQMRHERQLQTLSAEKAQVMRNATTGILALLVLAGIVAGLMQRRRHRQLRRVSAVDSLTGLKNRRTATGELNAMAQRAPTTSGTRHVLFLIDIDHFKKINDTLGHHAGDAVLVDMSARLKAACRPGDLVSRWGGEEFLVACPDLDRQQAEQTAVRLCKAMMHMLETDDVSWPVTVSLGLAPIPFFDVVPEGHVARRWDYALRMADRALYAAKETRNAWVGYWGARLPDDATAEAVLEHPEAAEGIITVLSSLPRSASDARVRSLRQACAQV